MLNDCASKSRFAKTLLSVDSRSYFGLRCQFTFYFCDVMQNCPQIWSGAECLIIHPTLECGRWSGWAKDMSIWYCLKYLRQKQYPRRCRPYFEPVDTSLTALSKVWESLQKSFHILLINLLSCILWIPLKLALDPLYDSQNTLKSWTGFPKNHHEFKCSFYSSLMSMILNGFGLLSAKHKPWIYSQNWEIDWPFSNAYEEFKKFFWGQIRIISRLGSISCILARSYWYKIEYLWALFFNE